MTGFFGRLSTAWRQIVKRGLSHWRLLSSVVLGVLLASAIMAGTVIYFDALREVALKRALSQHSQQDLDILIQGTRGPTTADEYERVRSVATTQVEERVDWLLSDQLHAGKSQTFFLSFPGGEATAGQDNARTYFAFMPRFDESVSYLSGGAPSTSARNAPGGPLEIEAAVPSEAARLFGLSVGDKMSAVPFWDDTTPHVTVTISGIFVRDDPDADIWQLETRVLQAATGPSFRTLPFHIQQQTYLQILGPSLRKLDSTYAWLLVVDTGRVHARNSVSTLVTLVGMNRSLGSVLSGYSQVTRLDEVLRAYERRLFFTKLPMFVVLVLIAIVILYYVTTLSSLIVEERRTEISLLRSRGATPAQILAVFVLEGLTIAGLATVLGPLIAAAATSMLGYTPAFSDLTGGGRLGVDLSRGAYMMSALGGVLSFAALIVPAFQASRIGVTQHRQEAARPNRIPAFQRYYFDVGLLLVGIFLFRQLSEQGSVVATRLLGDVAVDQLLLAVPGLLLVASAMVLLRLFPLVMSVLSRLLSGLLPVGLMMGTWQMARNPTHYARLSLLLVLTAGLGIFAASFGATLDRSFTERVLYSTGSDVRVEGVRALISRRGTFIRPEQGPPRPPLEEDFQRMPGVDTASPILRDPGNDLSRGLIGDRFHMIAMDASTFSNVAWFRDDFARKPIRSLLDDLRVPNPPDGIVLPEEAVAIGMTLKADRPHPSVRVTVRIRNAQNRHTTYTLGSLESAEWVDLRAPISQSAVSLNPTLPLQIVSVRIHEHSSPQLQGGSIVIDDIWIETPRGRVTVEAFDDAEGWSLLKATPPAASDVLRAADVSFDGGRSGSVVFTWTQGASRTARGIFAGPHWGPIPVLASKGFMADTGHAIGDAFEVLSGQYRVPVEIVEVVDLFPTMTRLDDKYMIADLESLTRFSNLEALYTESIPNEVWISTKTSGAQRERLLFALENSIAYRVGFVHDREQQLSQSEADPLVEAGWRALLFVAFGAVLILSCVGFLVHSYVSFRNRRTQFALLRTVGFSMRQLTTMVWLEQALVIFAGMALGTWMGGRLGAIIMPFLGHDDWGGRVVPPFVMATNWGALLLTYAAMAFVFAVISLGIIWLVQRISLHRVLRLGEM